MARLIEQLEEALVAQWQAEEAVEMIMEHLNAELNEGEMTAYDSLKEHEDKEAEANRALIEAVMEHMPAIAADSLKIVHEHQPTEAIRIAVGYAEAVTGIAFLSHA